MKKKTKREEDHEIMGFHAAVERLAEITKDDGSVVWDDGGTDWTLENLADATSPCDDDHEIDGRIYVVDQDGIWKVKGDGLRESIPELSRKLHSEAAPDIVH